jgi:hypothetical protein
LTHFTSILVDEINARLLFGVDIVREAPFIISDTDVTPLLIALGTRAFTSQQQVNGEDDTQNADREYLGHGMASW